jgi:hypothetical protein
VKWIINSVGGTRLLYGSLTKLLFIFSPGEVKTNNKLSFIAMALNLVALFWSSIGAVWTFQATTCVSILCIKSVDLQVGRHSTALVQNELCSHRHLYYIHDSSTASLLLLQLQYHQTLLQKFSVNNSAHMMYH